MEPSQAAGAAGPDSAAALLTLLDQGQAQSCEYGKGLSNHLPMALTALHRLGAGADRLHAFAQSYGKRLKPADAATSWPSGDAWTSRLGERQSFAAYRDLFSRWRDEEGAGRVLQQVLPALMPGCSGVAFHGLIRTAYAVQSRHAGEFASGLAYWACRWQSLGALPDRQPDTDEALALLRELPAVESGAGLIAERMLEAARRSPKLAEVVSRFHISPQTLPQLARLAAHACARSGNFTALHLLTSSHALRVLLPYLDEPEAALRCYWHAFAAAVSVAGFRSAEQAPPRSWEELVAAALTSDDDHVIKLVDSCREQARAESEAHADGELWRRAASRVVFGP